MSDQPALTQAQWKAMWTAGCLAVPLGNQTLYYTPTELREMEANGDLARIQRVHNLMIRNDLA